MPRLTALPFAWLAYFAVQLHREPREIREQKPRRARWQELFFSELMPLTADTTDSKLKNFLQKFLVLRSAPRELWIIYLA